MISFFLRIALLPLALHYSIFLFAEKYIFHYKMNKKQDINIHY